MANLNKTNVLVIGGQSTLGKYFISALKLSGYSVDFTSRKPEKNPGSIEFDLRESNLDFITKEYAYAYNFAGITGEAACSTNPESTMINVNKTLSLLEYLSKKVTNVYQISTGKVLSGVEKGQNFKSTLRPEGIYANQKAMVERQSDAINFKIIRFGKIITPESSFLLDWVGLLIKGVRIRAFTNVYISPLNINDLTSLLVALMPRTDIDIVQFSSLEDLSYFEIALMICRKFEFDSKLIIPTLNSATESMRYGSLEANPTELKSSLPTAKEVISNYLDQISS